MKSSTSSKLAILGATVLSTVCSLSGQTTIAFFDGETASNSAGAVTGVTVSNIGLPGATNLTDFSVDVANGDYEASNWTTDDSATHSDHLDSALVFTITAEAGYTVTLNQLSFVYKP